MMGRPRCERCGRPESVCLCAELPAAPLHTRTTVLILQHPHEARHKLSTLPILRTSLSNLHICVGRKFQRGSFPLLDSLLASHQQHQNSTSPAPPPAVLLLFPSHNAQPLPLWFSRHHASGCPICCRCPSSSAHPRTEPPLTQTSSLVMSAFPVKDPFRTLVAEPPAVADPFRTPVSKSSVADSFRTSVSESPVAGPCQKTVPKSGSLFSSIGDSCFASASEDRPLFPSVFAFSRRFGTPSRVEHSNHTWVSESGLLFSSCPSVSQDFRRSGTSVSESGASKLFESLDLPQILGLGGTLSLSHSFLLKCKLGSSADFHLGRSNAEVSSNSCGLDTVNLCRAQSSRAYSSPSSDLVTANSTSISCNSASTAFPIQATSADIKLGISNSATCMLLLELDSSSPAIRASRFSGDTFNYSRDGVLSVPRSLDSSFSAGLSKVKFEREKTVGTSALMLDLDTNAFGSVSLPIRPAWTHPDLDLVRNSNPSCCLPHIKYDTLVSAIVSGGVVNAPRVAVDFGHTKAPEAHIVLLVVDATWQHASEMIKASSSYLERFAIPVCLHYDVQQDGNAMANSDLTLRKEPFAGCLTTLEAVATSLRILEHNGSEIEQKLLSVLRRMVHCQSSHVSAHKVRNHPRKKKTSS